MSEMKVIMENWERFVINEQEPTIGSKTAGALSKVSSWIAKGFEKMDDVAREDYCVKKFPLHLKGEGDIQTWGDMVALMKCGIEYSDRKKVLGRILAWVPGLGPALQMIQDSNDMSQFITRAYQVDDDAIPSGNLGKLDMDDEVAAIIDDKVEKEFLKFLIAELTATKNLEQDIDPNWDITTALQAHLATAKDSRTITGFEKG